MRIKPYISYSQYILFSKSPAQYKKVYIDGMRINSKYLDFGSRVAAALETGEMIDTENLKRILASLPLVDKREKEIKVDFSGVPIFGRLDGFTQRKRIITIDEYKTGTVPWTQTKVDKSEQLDFYAILVHLKYKVPIAKIRILLHWMETYEDTDGSIHLTGRVFTFHTQRTTADMLNFYPKVKRAWDGIEKLIDSIV